MRGKAVFCVILCRTRPDALRARARVGCSQNCTRSTHARPYRTLPPGMPPHGAGGRTGERAGGGRRVAGRRRPYPFGFVLVLVLMRRVPSARRACSRIAARARARASAYCSENARDKRQAVRQGRRGVHHGQRPGCQRAAGSLHVLRPCVACAGVSAAGRYNFRVWCFWCMAATRLCAISYPHGSRARDRKREKSACFERAAAGRRRRIYTYLARGFLPYLP